MKYYLSVKIIADDKIPFLRGAFEPFAEVIYLPGGEITRDIINDSGAVALLIRTRTKCNGKLLRDTNIRFIATATIGFDHIDTEYCEENNIRWFSSPGCNSSSVQQYIAAALLTISSSFAFSLSRKTLGIIGVGNVGSKVAKLGKTLGMNVLLNDPPRSRKEGDMDFVSIERVLRESDIITLHVPLTMTGEDRSYHLFNDNTFKMMKDGSWFINSSRGEVTETAALKNVLKSGKISGAVIDVWENEPGIDHDLLSDATIATPHIAGYSTDGKANGTAMVVNSLSSFFGLSLKDWYPDNIPRPAVPEIDIDGRGRTDEDIIREAVLHTYNIIADDAEFRRSPSGFEKQRGDYPLRREFSSYSVKLSNSSDYVRSVLKEIGFRLSNINDSYKK
jgi:erythronate-4-phosphate dehydrogenase